MNRSEILAPWLRRHFFAASLLTLVACAAPIAGPEHGNPALYGRWKTVSGKVYLSDGTVRTQSDVHCVAEVSERQIATSCVLPNGTKARVISRIVSLDVRRYETEIVENTGTPGTVGLRSRAEYRIEEDKLLLTVYPTPFKPPSGGPYSVKLESVSIRE